MNMKHRIISALVTLLVILAISAHTGFSLNYAMAAQPGPEMASVAREKAVFRAVLNEYYGQRASNYASLVWTESVAVNVNPYLTAAIIDAESSWKSSARGKDVTVNLTDGPRQAYAIGLMQVMNFHVSDENILWNPVYNVRKGVAILSHYQAIANGNLKITIKNYNSGPASFYYNHRYINKVTDAYIDMMEIEEAINEQQVSQ